MQLRGARAVTPPMRPSVWFSFVLLFAHGVVIFGFGFALLRLLGVDPRTIPTAPPLAFVALAVAAVLDVGIVFVGLLRRLGVSLRELGWAGIARRDIATGLVGAALLIGVALATLAARAGSFGDALDRLVEGIASMSARERAFCMLIGVIAAFTEESLFRGYMQPAMQHKLGRWSGLLVTALVFAAYHGRFAPVLLIGKVGVGVVLGGIRERTGTLWAPALAHVLTWSILGMT